MRSAAKDDFCGPCRKNLGRGFGPRADQLRQAHRTLTPPAISQTAQRACRYTARLPKWAIFSRERDAIYGMRSIKTHLGMFDRRRWPAIFAVCRVRPAIVACLASLYTAAKRPASRTREQNASSRTPWRCSVDLIRYTQPTRLLIAVRLIFLHCRQTAVKGLAAIRRENQFVPSGRFRYFCLHKTLRSLEMKNTIEVRRTKRGFWPQASAELLQQDLRRSLIGLARGETDFRRQKKSRNTVRQAFAGLFLHSPRIRAEKSRACTMRLTIAHELLIFRADRGATMAGPSSLRKFCRAPFSPQLAIATNKARRRARRGHGGPVWERNSAQDSLRSFIADSSRLCGLRYQPVEKGPTSSKRASKSSAEAQQRACTSAFFNGPLWWRGCRGRFVLL